MFRFILNMSPTDHIGNAGNVELKLGFIMPKDRLTQLGMNLVYSVYYDKCPEYLKLFFQ